MRRERDTLARLVSQEVGKPLPQAHAEVDFAEGFLRYNVMIEETFGPVTPIVGIDSIEEALQVASASRYDLSAYVFSRDCGTVMRTVGDLDFGEIYVNRTLGESIHALLAARRPTTSTARRRSRGGVRTHQGLRSLKRFCRKSTNSLTFAERCLRC